MINCFFFRESLFSSRLIHLIVFTRRTLVSAARHDAARNRSHAVANGDVQRAEAELRHDSAVSRHLSFYCSSRDTCSRVRCLTKLIVGFFLLYYYVIVVLSVRLLARGAKRTMNFVKVRLCHVRARAWRCPSLTSSCLRAVPTRASAVKRVLDSDRLATHRRHRESVARLARNDALLQELRWLLLRIFVYE